MQANVLESVQLEQTLIRAAGLFLPLAVLVLLALLRVGSFVGRGKRSVVPADFVTEEDILDDLLDDENDGDGRPHANGADAETAPLTSGERRAGPSFTGKTVAVAIIAAVQALILLAELGAERRSSRPTESVPSQAGAALLWLYIAGRMASGALRKTIVKAPLDVFSSLLLLILGTLMRLHYACLLLPIVAPLPTTWPWHLWVALLLQLVALLIMLRMPMTPGYKRQDDSKDLSSKMSPEDNCNLWEWITFAWMNPVFLRNKDKGYLDEDRDIWRISRQMRARILARKFHALGHGRSTLSLILSANGKDIALDISLTICSSVLTYAAPFFLRRILQVIENGASISGEEQEREHRAAVQVAYLFAAFAFVATALRSQADLQHLYFARRACVRMRSELMTAIYIKALRKKDSTGIAEQGSAAGPDGKKADDAEMKKKGIGAVVSLMASDTVKISVFANRLSGMLTAPLEIVIAMTFLYRLLGWSAFAGIAATSLAVPLQSELTRRSMALTRILGTLLDKRMSALSELITNLKTFRFYGWEDTFVKRIVEIRDRELVSMWKRQLLQAATLTLWAFVPNAVTICSFASYTLIAGRTLTVSTAFTSLNIFNYLGGPLNLLPSLLNEFATVLVAFQRMDLFLQQDEVPAWVASISSKYGSEQAPAFDSPPNASTRIRCRDATFRWPLTIDSGTKELGKKQGTFSAIMNGFRNVSSAANGTSATRQPDYGFELSKINLDIRPGTLVVIAGPTASGKSSLLQALLGEMDLIAGHLEFPKDARTRNVSYCAQQVWLQSASIRENIVFGAKFEPERYIAVIKACALLPDLMTFTNGDEEEIGEQGIILSGGQKSRIALARALYSRSEIILLDDVLAAVDAHTAKHLVAHALTGPLVQGRTMIIATHHHQLLASQADQIIRMREGAIDSQPPSVMPSGTATPTTVPASRDPKQDDAAEKPAAHIDGLSKVMVREQGHQTGKLYQKEIRSRGRVRWEVYRAFLTNAGLHYVTLTALLVITGKAWDVVNQFWLSAWAESYNKPDGIDRLHVHFPSATKDVRPYIGIYFALGMAITGTAMLVGVVSSAAGLRAMKRVFDGMLESVLRASNRWIDTQPSGRLTNRFAKDVITIGTSLTGNMRNVAQMAVAALISLFVLTTTLPAFLLPACVLLVGYYYFASLYSGCSRELRRIESTTRSPIYQGFSEMLRGIVTVRAFCAEERLLAALFKDIDFGLASFNFFWQTTRWLFLRFDMLGATSVLSATILALNGSIAPGLAAIAISQAQSFSNNLFWTTRSYTSLEQDLTSMERAVEIMPPRIPSEKGLLTEGGLPDAWPSRKADIEFKNVTMAYDPSLPAVLKGVSVRIEPGHRVGICGRTGSGKSTLAMTLLRPVELTEGSITIEGHDISRVGVQDLRRRIGLISQDPLLFAGTVRENLDPFSRHTEEELNRVLSRVRLTSAATAEATDGVKQIDLDTMLAEEGGNLSAGQRQLLAMARVLLRRNTIVIADEATASVDLETDRHIQEVMREELTDCILLTIGHRIATIIDYDRILVMDDGRLAEYDTPANLLRSRTSLFHQICERSEDYQELLRRALG